MKRILIYILFLSVPFLIGACDDFLDVNENPNSSVNADADLLFTGAAVEHVNNRTQYLQMFGNYYTQHVTSGNAASLITQWENYTYPATILSIWTNNTWLTFGNAESMVLAGQTALELGRDNTLAQTIIFKSQIFLDLTMLYERIPYSDALTVGVDHPSFDDQVDILNGLVVELDSAINLIDTNTGGGVENGDLIYQGDLTKWIKYANSLKLKILMLLANGGEPVDTEIAAVINGGMLFESNDDDAGISFVDTPGQENPGWGFWDQYGSLNFPIDGEDRVGFEAYLTDGFADVLDDYAVLDPRIGLYFDRPDGITTFESIAVGDDEIVDETAYADENIFSNTIPDYFITYSDVQLMVAEAILKGYVAGDAQTAYENGVEASIMRYDAIATRRNLADGDLAAYMGSLPNLATPPTTDNASTALEHVYVQQYIDSFARGLEGWTSWRKNKVPALSAHPDGNIGGVIRRWPYDDDEPNININFPENVSALGDEMWYE